MIAIHVRSFLRHLGYDLGCLFGLRGKDRRIIDRGKDRRRSPRVHSRNLIKVILSDGKPQNRIFNLVDISDSGFQFTGLECFKSGAYLHLILNVCEFNQRIPMNARIIWSKPIKARVVWEESGGRNHLNQAGAAIIEIAEADRYMLKDFINSKLHRNHYFAD